MQIKVILSKDKKRLTALGRLTKRKFHREPVVVLTRKEVEEFVLKQYPEFEIVSGPRKLSNRENKNLEDQWEFSLKNSRDSTAGDFSKRVSAVVSKPQSTRRTRRTKKVIDKKE